MPGYCFFCVSEDGLLGVLGEELLGEELLGEALELEPLDEDDLSLEDGVDEAPEAEELGVLLLGELDIEPEPDDEEPEGVDEDEPDDSGLLDLLEPAPVVELAPRSQP